MRPGRGAAQHPARKHVSRDGTARYLSDPQTGRLPTWPDRTFITIASIRITGYTGSKGLGRIGAAAFDLDLRAFAPRRRCRTDQAASPCPTARRRAEVEPSGYESLPGTGYHPAADPGWKVVARAEFLLTPQHRLPYNLIGHNCEIIANLCASQNWTESYQIRRWFGRKGIADGVLILGLAVLSRTGRALPRWSIPVIVVWMAGGMAAIYTLQRPDPAAMERDPRRLAGPRADA